MHISTRSLSIVALVSFVSALTKANTIVPGNAPTFVLDFDEHPSTRYNEMFLHFKEQLIKMENLFFYSVAPNYREVFKQKTPLFEEKNPEAYYSMEALANITGLELYQTLLVNSIVDFSAWCTSIVARMENGTIIHARNLDFDFPSIMEKMVYRALIKKDGKIVGEAAAIAGYIGFYTGLRYDTFTVSYNVRIIRNNQSDIMENIDRELQAGTLPTA